MLPIGTKVKIHDDEKLSGRIAGYGFVNDDHKKAVDALYIVELKTGLSSELMHHIFIVAHSANVTEEK